MVSKRVNPFFRTGVLLATLAASASGQQRVSSPPDNADRAHPVPVQTYAVIDISGSTTSSSIYMVALDDANQASFGFFTGTDPAGVSAYAEYDTYTWNGGTLGPKNPTPLTVDVDDSSPYETGYTTVGIWGQSPNGKVWGTIGQDWYFNGDGEYDGTSYLLGYYDGRTIDLPAPFVTKPNYPGNGSRVDISDVSEQGIIVGSAIARVTPASPANPFNTYFAYKIDLQGNILIFDNRSDYSNVTWPANSKVQIIKSDGGLPLYVNNNGWMTAGRWGTVGTSLWQGTAPWKLFNDNTSDLNDQNQVAVMSAQNSQNGYLWENGGATQFVFPRALQGQLTNIQPFSISNQAVPAPAANVDKAIHILAMAKDNGVNVTVVGTRDNAEVWTFAEIQVPEGVTISDYTTINSSGVIAAIGNAGTGDRHALLLVPCDIEPDNSYNSGSGFNQTNAVINNDTTPDGGNVGSLVDSVFKGQRDKHPQKHYVSPKNPLPLLPSSYLAFKSGLPSWIASKFKWITDNEPQTILPTNNDATQDVFVKRDQASHVVLQLQLKNGSTALSDKMNVWVVWDNIDFEPELHEFVAHTELRGETGSVIGSFIADGYTAIHTIVPPGILTDPDHPNLAGINTVAVPGATLIHHMTGLPLSKGANSKWDPSQQSRCKIINPSAIPNSLIAQPPSSQFSYPDDPLIGNDDCYTNNGSTDPYTHYGVLSFQDIPAIGIVDGAGKNGDTYEKRLQFISFGRAQIGNTWYIISDPHPWRVHLKLKNSNGTWVDNMTANDKALDNANW